MSTDSKGGLAVKGLEGVSVGETRIALVDGENGRLIFCGHDAERLAQEACFEETAHLLWTGRMPDAGELADLRQRLIAGLTVPEPVLEVMRQLEPDGIAMDVLRSGLSAWATLRHRAEGG